MDAIDTGGFTGDQTGMGQGLAYVLPQSRSVGYFMQLANEKAQERRQQAALLAQQQQKANEEYAQHLYNTKTPQIATEFTKYLQPQFDDLLNQSADYNKTTGQDPFTHPGFIQRRNELTNIAGNTQELHKEAIALGTALGDRGQNYSPESRQVAQAALDEYWKNPTAYLSKPFPTLERRDLDLNDAHKLAGPGKGTENTISGYNVTTADRNSNLAKSRLTLSQPEFAPMLERQYNVDQHVGDVFSIPNGHGGALYPTDAPHLNSIVDQILQNAGQPHYAATLQAANIDPLDPHAKDKLFDLALKQNKGYAKAYGDLADRLDADVENKKIRNFGEDRLALSEANLALARERNQRAADKLTQPTYVQNLAEKTRNTVLSGLQNGPQNIKNPLPELENLFINNPNFRHTLSPQVNQDGTIVINVPAEYKTNPKGGQLDENGKVVPNSDRMKVKDGYTVTLDPTNAEQFNTAYGALFDRATGEKTGQASKINTLGGKGHLPVVPNSGKQQTKITPQDFNAQWGKLPKGGQLMGPDGVLYTKQ